MTGAPREARGRRVIAVAVTPRGRALVERLPYERSPDGLGATLRAQWADADAFVAVAAVGAVVRVAAPLLGTKSSDPAVVVLDEEGRFAVSVLGGHHGANELAREVAALLGAEPVLSTASDTAGTPALDELSGSGLVAEGDLASVGAALASGEPVGLDNPLGWPLPERLAELLTGGGERPGRVLVTDALAGPEPGLAVLRPPSLVAGVGASSGAPADELAALLSASLDAAGLSRASLGALATIDRRAGDEALSSIGLPIEAFPADELATGAAFVPNPSEVVAGAVGTPSVAEAAALLAAGPDGELVVAKQKSPHFTVAIARRKRPAGHLSLVGLGPGARDLRTPAADRAIRNAEVVVGYEAYVSLCSDLLTAAQHVLASPIGAESERAETAVKWAASGRRVAVVCSGDPGVYAMATLVLERAGERPGFPVEVVPGVTAALASAALLGAPLAHDHLVLSLSDLLTPWETIVRRAEAARDADLAIAVYNPRSKGRDWQLAALRDLLLRARPPTTPVGLVTDAGRPGERVVLTTLAALDPELVGMTTCVIIGSSTTTVVGGRMVTPRGYPPRGAGTAPR